MIYTRVSKYREGSRSVEDQEQECRAECERRGWPVRRVLTDRNIGASRWSGKDRPAWEELKENLRPGDVLVTWEASRMQRDMDEYVVLRALCDERKVPLSYSGRIYDLSSGDDRFAAGVDVLFAEREAELLQQRTLRGVRSSAVSGKPAGSVAPWGYVRINKSLEVDPIEAPVVRLAVSRVLAGEGMGKVWRDMRMLSKRCPRGLTVFQRAISNPALAGLRVHRGEVIGDGNWEPILSREDHEALMVRIRRNKATSRPGRRDPKYLLSGIATCTVCREPLHVRKYTKSGRAPAYSCHHGHVHRLMTDLDEYIVKKLFERLSEEDQEKASVQESDDKGLQKELDEADAKLEEWRVAAENEEITLAAFARMEKKLVARIEELRARQMQSEVPVRVTRRGWDRAPIEMKRAAIRAYFTITVSPIPHRGRRASNASDGVAVARR